MSTNRIFIPRVQCTNTMKIGVPEAEATEKKQTLLDKASPVLKALLQRVT